jgi:hypothetical protein
MIGTHRGKIIYIVIPSVRLRKISGHHPFSWIPCQVIHIVASDGHAIPSKSNPPPEPGHADALKSGRDRISEVDNRANITAIRVSKCKEQCWTLGNILLNRKATGWQVTRRTISRLESQLPLSIDRNSRKDGDDYDIFGNLNHRKC